MKEIDDRRDTTNLINSTFDYNGLTFDVEATVRDRAITSVIVSHQGTRIANPLPAMRLKARIATWKAYIEL
jgi:hypothetical protein